MNRRYNRWWSRFDQPDPYDGSYDITNPQSLNRYTYVNNDPVNFVDPSGLVLDCRTGVDGRITCRDIGGGPGIRIDGGGLFIHGQRETIRSNDSLLDWYLRGRNLSPQFRGGTSFDGSRRVVVAVGANCRRITLNPGSELMSKSAEITRIV